MNITMYHPDGTSKQIDIPDDVVAAAARLKQWARANNYNDDWSLMGIGPVDAWVRQAKLQMVANMAAMVAASKLPPTAPPDPIRDRDSLDRAIARTAVKPCGGAVVTHRDDRNYITTCKCVECGADYQVGSRVRFCTGPKQQAAQPCGGAIIPHGAHDEDWQCARCSTVYEQIPVRGHCEKGS